jgi:hypothetical protein
MSLNKFQQFEGYDLNFKVGCDELKCNKLIIEEGGRIKLVGGVFYNNLDVSGITSLYINEPDVGGNTAVINGLQGGIDGQIITVTAGSFGGFVEFRHNATTGAPNEENLFTQTQANITIPNPPSTYNGRAILQFVASQNKWLCNAG